METNIESQEKVITIGEVKELLNSGKTVLVQTLNNEYAPVTSFIEKGILDTFNVILENGKSIRVSRQHKFFTDSGWLETHELIPNKHKILCDDQNYYLINEIKFVGKERIVDISVDHTEHCYFGNGMLNHNSGKSLLCGHIIAETQKKGGIGIYIDTEHALDESFFTAIGVDFSKLLYIPLSKIEDVFAAAETVITKIRASHKDKPVTIVIDSIMGAKTEREEGGDYTKDGYATDKAILLSKAMRKITELISWERILFVCTNQLRTILNAMQYSEKWTTSGGKAIAFHSSVRLRLTAVGKIKAEVNGVETVVGMKTRAVVIKNRMGPPHKSVNFDIYFDSGIDNYGGWLNVLKSYKIIKQTGSWYSYINSTDEEVKFQAKEFAALISENQLLRQELYDKICENYIMKYNPAEHEGEIRVVGVNDEGDDEETAAQLDGIEEMNG